MNLYRFSRPGARAAAFFAVGATLAWLAAVVFLWPVAAPAQSAGQDGGTVRGRIVGDPAKGAVQGATVVLMQFELDADGQPKGGPIARQNSGAEGSFEFTDVPINTEAVYQLGTRIDGKLVGSEMFTFPEGQRAVQVNLMLDEMQQSEEGGLRAPQAILVIEPQVGATWVTEVLHLRNGGHESATSKDEPLELHVPEEANSLEMLRQPDPGVSHERMGSKLLVYGALQPGLNTIAFRYRMPASFGGFSMSQRYPVPVENVTVLTPARELKVEGPGLMSQGQRQIESTMYDTWSKMGVPAGTSFRLEVSGVPIPQTHYLFSLAAFAVVMVGVVTVFWRRRLRHQGDVASHDSAD